MLFEPSVPASGQAPVPVVWRFHPGDKTIDGTLSVWPFWHSEWNKEECSYAHWAAPRSLNFRQQQVDNFQNSSSRVQTSAFLSFSPAKMLQLHQFCPTLIQCCRKSESNICFQKSTHSAKTGFRSLAGKLAEGAAKAGCWYSFCKVSMPGKEPACLPSLPAAEVIISFDMQTVHILACFACLFLKLKPSLSFQPTS